MPDFWENKKNKSMVERGILFAAWSKILVHIAAGFALVFAIGVVADGAEVEGQTQLGLAMMFGVFMWWMLMQAVLTYIYARLLVLEENQ